jgi:2-oxoglutarate dehydrogenase E2 component (dihydrolipoamide succinyltransferase)
MSIAVSVPNLPESVQDATLMEWRKQPGDTVTKGETLVELETDKVVLDVPAPQDGVLGQHMRKKGELVVSGDALTVIEAASAVAPAPVAPEPPAPPVVAAPAPEPAPTAPVPPAVAEAAPASVYTQPVSPAVRRLLTEHQLDTNQITGSGKDGRLTKQDILEAVDAQKSKPVAPPPRPAPIPPASSGTEARGGVRRVPMSRLRARIAERLLESQRNTATLTTFNEVNMHKVFEVRNAYKAQFEQKHKVKLGFMSFFVKATVEALKRFPSVNASIEGDDIVYHDYYDIGIAVSSDRGLVVPVLRGADKLDFGAIEKSVIEFGAKARDGKLSFEELSGGTFTITNGGTFGSMLSTPILNPPQSGILGMHAIKDRPVVENGQIVIRPMIYLAFSYDHRLIDGREAVLFLYTIKELLEDPVRLVLHV